MVEGIKLDFTGPELIEHAQKRVQYHESRYTEYKVKAQELLRGTADAMDTLQAILDDTLTETSGYGRATNKVQQDVEGATGKAKRHWDKVKRFKVYAAHFLKDETYRLGERDLDSLELV